MMWQGFPKIIKHHIIIDMVYGDSIQILRSKILEKRPILGQIFEDHSSISVNDYSANLNRSPQEISNNRKKEFISVFIDIAKKYFDQPALESLDRQLTEHYCISTAEHHGPMMHPFFVHSNLLASISDLENIIVLAVGNVSLNNSSYPRGLVMHSADGAQVNLPFFSSDERMSPVFGHRGYNNQDLAKLHTLVKEKSSHKILSRQVADNLQNVIDWIYGSAAGEQYYSDQITRTNFKLWQYLLRYGQAKMPRLVNLQLEDIILQLLTRHHLTQRTEIHDLIFNQDIRSLSLRETDGIPGNFSLKEKKGTFLFWAIPSGSRHRQQLWPEGNYLVSSQGYRLLLEPTEIELAINRGELIPNMFLGMVMLSEYYGVKCLGGFSQGTYLTKMAEAYTRIFALDPRPGIAHTTGLRSDLVLAYFQDRSGHLRGASGLDLVLHHTPDSWLRFCQTAKKLTLEESMAPLFPELYRILYTNEERDQSLAFLTNHDMVLHYGLTEKISPCIGIC